MKHFCIPSTQPMQVVKEEVEAVELQKKEEEEKDLGEEEGRRGKE